MRIMNDKSALVKYTEENPSHFPDFNSAEQIEIEPRHFHRKFKEHLHIITNDTINISRGQQISAIWDASLPALMKPLKKPK